MGYNRCILFGLLFLSFVSMAWGQDRFGFGGSVERSVDIVDTHISDNMMLFLYEPVATHLLHHGISLESDVGILSLSQRIQMLITTDVVSLLDQAVDKHVVLIQYLDTVDSILHQARIQGDVTSLRLSVLQERMRTCLVDKDIADRAFFDAVNANDDIAARRALDDSLVASTCATEYRVQYNALQAQYDKLIFYVDVLQKKYDYIISRQDMIVQHFSILRVDLLKELTAIAAELQRFTVVR